MIVGIYVQIWAAFEAEGCDGSAAARDVHLTVDLEAGSIKSASIGKGPTCALLPLAVLMVLVGRPQWNAFVADALRLAQRRADDPEYRAFRAEEETRGRADEANDCARAS
jgi:hypothetical protein